MGSPNVAASSWLAVNGDGLKWSTVDGVELARGRIGRGVSAGWGCARRESAARDALLRRLRVDTMLEVR